MYVYYLIYIIAIVFFQFYSYMTWKKAQGEKQIIAFLNLGRLYPSLLLFPIIYILPNTSIFFWIKAYFISFWTIAFVANIMIHRYFVKSFRAFQSALRPDSKIIILGMYSVGTPWNPYFKFLDIASILIGASIKYPLFIQQEKYLITQEIIAFASYDETKKHPAYIWISSFRLSTFVKKRLAFWEKTAKLYLISRGKNKKLSEDISFFSADKVRFMDEEDVFDFPQCLIGVIESDFDIREKTERALACYLSYQGAEAGKRYLAQLINHILEKRRSVTEYFYELMKMAEFMIHYQSLADYEKAEKHYFDSNAPISIGTFEAGIADTESSSPNNKEDYIQAIKYLNQLCTGKEGSVNRQKLLMEGRKRLVMVRNRFIGHGSLSYGVNADFVQQLLVIVTGQAEDFFNHPEPMIRQLCIHEVPKFRMQGTKLYLLVQLERGTAGYYLDYGSGRFLTDTQQGKIYEHS